MTVFYDDPTHTYYTCTDNQKVVYTSATQLISRYKVPFDKDRMAVLTAQKRGGTPEYWKTQWEKVSKEACDYGTQIHDQREQEMIARGTQLINGRMFRVQNRVPDHFCDYFQLEDGVYPELKLWHHGYRIAGRTDRAILETVCTDKTGRCSRYMHIDDYKTNKKIDLRAYRFKDGSYKMMLTPVDHLEDCNFNHYALQLSLYLFMGEAMGFMPGNMKLIHIPKDGPATEYEVPYLKSEIIDILTHSQCL